MDYPSLPRCAVVRYRREGSKIHWTPCNAEGSKVAAKVGNFEHAFQLEQQYSSRAIGRALKPSNVDNEPVLAEPPQLSPVQVDKSTKKSMSRSWFRWRKNTNTSGKRKSRSGRFDIDDLASSLSVPARWRSAPNVFEDDNSVKARHSVHETPWCNGAYLSRTPSGHSSGSSLQAFGNFRCASLPYNSGDDFHEDDDDDEFLTLKKNHGKKSSKWMAILRKRLSKRKMKTSEFDDRIGIHAVDSYY